MCPLLIICCLSSSDFTDCLRKRVCCWLKNARRVITIAWLISLVGILRVIRLLHDLSSPAVSLFVGPMLNNARVASCLLIFFLEFFLQLVFHIIKRYSFLLLSSLLASPRTNSRMEAQGNASFDNSFHCSCCNNVQHYQLIGTNYTISSHQYLSLSLPSSATPAAFAAMWTCLVLIVLSIMGTVIMRKVRRLTACCVIMPACRIVSFDRMKGTTFSTF